MQKIIALFILLSITGCSSPSGEPASSKIKWVYDYRQGIEQAKESGKPVMLFFSASWCPPCKILLTTVFSDEDVARVSERFINIYVDVDEDTRTRTKYKIREIPAIFFLNSNGEMIEKFSGARTASQFIKTMNAIAAGYPGLSADS